MEQTLVVTETAAAEVAMHPVRAAILDALGEAGSATTVAAAIGSTRQKVNYHLRALEAHGLVEPAETRAWGGITERFVRRAARHLVIAPDLLHRVGIDPEQVADTLSADYLIAVSSRTVRELADVVRTATGRRVPTLTLDAVVGLRSAEDRNAFAADLQAAVASVVARYHHDDGRPHRLTVTSYPRPAKETP